MRPVRQLQRLLLVAALAGIPGCDPIGGHGNVDIVNNTGVALTRVQLVYNGGDEEGGATAIGGTVHFTGVPVGSVTAYGYATNPTAIASASGSVSADQTITLTLVAH